MKKKYLLLVSLLAVASLSACNFGKKGQGSSSGGGNTSQSGQSSGGSDSSSGGQSSDSSLPVTNSLPSVSI